MTIHAQLLHTAQAKSSLTTLSDEKHAWASDVDKTLGGTDLAPDPHDLLDSALAACTVLTLELYIRRKGWAVRAIEVKIDRTESKTEDGRVRYELKRHVHVEGDIAEAERSRLLEIANKCPIHRILTGEIKVDSVLA